MFVYALRNRYARHALAPVYGAPSKRASSYAMRRFDGAYLRHATMLYACRALDITAGVC